MRWLLMALMTMAPLGLVLGVNGCATAGSQLRLPGQVALRGVELQRGMQAVLDAAEAAEAAGLLGTADLVTVARIGERVGLEGERLAVVLAQIDAATDPVTEAIGIGRAQIIVQTIQSSLVAFPEVPPVVETALVVVTTTLAVLATELQA